MAKFRWTGRDGHGHGRTGELDASGVEEAALRAREGGILVVTLDRLDPERAAPAASVDAFAQFNRNLASSVSLGIPLPQAIASAARGLRRGRFRAALEKVEAGLREGHKLEDLVDALESDAPQAYRWMLRAAADSGDLAGVLSAVARNAEAETRVSAGVTDALAYPALVILVGAGLLAALLAAFGPTYAALLFRHVPSASSAARAVARVEAAPFVAATLVAGAGLLMAWALGRPRLLDGLPLLGRVRGSLALARLFGTLGVLLRGRVPLPDALAVALAASGRRDHVDAAEALRARAREGAGICDLLGDLSGVDPGLLAPICVAERGGGVEGRLQDLADLLSERARAEAERMGAILAPAALFAVGLLIAAVVTALVLPYVEFIRALGR